ncbi:MFS family permease [Catenulispora sp. MAP5-51]|uniref:MFS transporter n=1 Tax=Catenulispora sp. MAP5-51 TaxID=3156298 RepID=UPI0035197D18
MTIDLRETRPTPAEPAAEPPTEPVLKLASKRAAKPAPKPAALVRANRAFRDVYTAAAISKLGTAVGTLAVPLVAQLVLHTSAAGIGVLAALNTGAFLLIGLPAGVWVERMRRRPLLIAADLARAAAFGSVPVAAFCGVLTYFWLCAVVAVAGVATVFFDVASLSYLPHVVGRDRLVEANASLVGMDAVGQIAGRGLAGLLVQALTASGVVALDAVSYLASALFLMRVRKPEPAPAVGAARDLRAEMLEGLRFVLGDRVLRPLVLKGALANLATMLIVTLLPTYFVLRLGTANGPSLLGAFLALGAVGSLLGARSAPWLGRRFGATRTMWLASLVTAPISLLIPLVGHGPWLVVAALAWAVTLGRVGLDNVLGVSLRQAAAPEAMAGRVNATFRFLLFGALSLGSLLAGVIGATLGIQACLWAGAVGLALLWVPVYFSALGAEK